MCNQFKPVSSSRISKDHGKTFHDIGDLFSFKNLNTVNTLCEYCDKVLNVFV